jgi:hypothetical protein
MARSPIAVYALADKIINRIRVDQATRSIDPVDYRHGRIWWKATATVSSRAGSASGSEAIPQMCFIGHPK